MTITPWTNQDGRFAHPNAPIAGGGLGRGKDPRPYGMDFDHDAYDVLPHPDSPAARQVLFDAKTTRKAAAETKKQPVWKDDDALNEEVRKRAAGLVGQESVGDKECAALPDRVLDHSGGKSAPDFSGRITDDGDYKWGRPLDKLSDIKPGDILQFRNHENKVEESVRTVLRGPNGERTERKPMPPGVTYKRGHHSAVVLSVNDDGSLTVAEQHVQDRENGGISKTVRSNRLYLKDFRSEEKKQVQVGGSEGEQVTVKTVKVQGKVWAYRPQPKDAP